MTTTAAGPTNVEELLLASRTRGWCASGEARRIREESRLTLREMAAVVAVNHKAVHHWETGSRVPAGAYVLAYGRVLEALRSALLVGSV